MIHFYKYILVLFAFILIQPIATAQIYYSSDDSLWVLSSESHEPDLINNDRAEGIVVDTVAGYLFWTVTYLDDVIRRSNLDGSDIQTLVDDGGNYSGISADAKNGKIYWTNNENDGEILRANYDGSEVEVILSGEANGITDGVRDLALDVVNEKIYWSNYSAILRADMNGGNIDTLKESDFIQQNDVELNIEDGFLYWVHSANDNIMRIDLESMEEEELLNSNDITSIKTDLSSDKIYWMNDYLMNGEGGEIQRANLDGSNIETVMETGFITGAFYVVSGYQLATANEKEGKTVPSALVLHKNYPNPFNPQTTIQYQLPKTMTVTLSVYNFLGQKIQTLIQSEIQAAGTYSISFDASDKPSGIYFYRLESTFGNVTGRMTLIK